MIPASVIDDIRYRSDIESVISSYVTLKRAGSNCKGLCPFHSEKTPSFTVYNSTQSYYCFGCGAGGDVINFVMRIENLDYVSAVETLAKRAGITLPDFDDNYGQNGGVSRSRVLQMNLEAAKFYRKMLFDENIGSPGRQYFIDRGLSTASVKAFGLGYSPKSGGMLMSHLRSLGFSNEEIHTAYFAGKNDRGYYDYFRGRVMFPIIDVSGNVIAFGGRVLDDSKPKYLNTSDTPAFKKSKNLFALNYAKNANAGYMILCEGYMDVIALHNHGFKMAVATLGTAITSEQARMLKKYTDKVIISYDSDEAGKKAANRAISILEEAGLEAKVLKMSGAKDPDEFLRKYGADKFRALVEESRGKYDFKVEEVRAKYDLNNSAEKVKALSEICTFLSGIHSSVERDIYIDRCSRDFAIDIVSIKRDVESKRRKMTAENEKKRKGELVRVTAGIGDRVNPDYAKQPKAARLEKNILGMMLTKNEYINYSVGDRALSEDDFVTSFAKKLFSFIKNREADGRFNIGLLNENFTQDEVSRASEMIAEQNELSVNGESAFEAYVTALREEAGRISDGTGTALEDILRKKRGEMKKE